MKRLIYVFLFLLVGCSAAPLELSDHLSAQHLDSLQLETPPAKSMALAWLPQPIDDFIISQNADGLIGRSDYQDFAIGRLISSRVMAALGSVIDIDPKSDNRITVTIDEAKLRYKYGLNRLVYADLLLNLTVSADGRNHSKIYYRKNDEQPDLSPAESMNMLLDSISTEIARDILARLN